MRLSICHLALCLACVYILPDQVCSAANLIQNGDFESPQISADSDANVDPAPWVRIVDINGGLPNLLNGSPPGLNSLGPQSGNQFFYMGSAGAGIYQNFTLNAGGVFQLDWWITSSSEMTGTAHLPYDVRVFDFQDALITTGSFDAYSSEGQWMHKSLQFSAAAGDYKLEFISMGEEYDWNIFLDNVQLAAVPEPATYHLLTLGALLLLRRKKIT